MRILQLLWTVALSCSAFAEKPFVDLSFPKALAEAKATGKLVMIDFYTTWCPPCKLLDKTTWKDEAVQKWLEENTIPLKVDAERLAVVAKKYEVTAYPSIVFINADREAVGRFVGYRSPEDFIDAATDAIAGVTESVKLNRKTTTNKTDGISNPMKRMRLADKLVLEKKYKEALEHYAWCWEHGADSLGFTGVRVSYLLRSIEALASEYPPAYEIMEFWRDDLKTNYDSERPSREVCTDYYSLLGAMGVSNNELLRMYDELLERGRVGKRIQRWVGYLVTDGLFEQRRFEEYLSFTHVDTLISTLRYIATQERLRGTDNSLKQMEVTLVVEPWEALIALHRDETANAALKAILEHDASEVTVNLLLESANRVNRSDLNEHIKDVAKQVSQKE